MIFDLENRELVEGFRNKGLDRELFVLAGIPVVISESA
jgi:hypothetical protein